MMGHFWLVWPFLTDVCGWSLLQCHHGGVEGNPAAPTVAAKLLSFADTPKHDAFLKYFNKYPYLCRIASNIL